MKARSLAILAPGATSIQFPVTDGSGHIRPLQLQLEDKYLKMHTTTVTVNINIREAWLQHSTQHTALGSKFTFLLFMWVQRYAQLIGTNNSPSLAFGPEECRLLEHQSATQKQEHPTKLNTVFYDHQTPTILKQRGQGCMIVEDSVELAWVFPLLGDCMVLKESARHGQ